MALHVAVLIAGIVDSKWRACDLGLPLDGGAAGVGVPRTLSPFDEAAIECALKLRDAAPSTHLKFVVGCETGDAGLLRAVSAFRPASLQGVIIAQDIAWDTQALAVSLAGTTVCEGAQADLVLVGREFGDFDDGVFAPCLAQALASPFIALAQEVRWDDGGLEVTRERGNVRESLRHQGPVVASVTNAKSNRLRYPLMKNVMAAKREPINTAPLAGEPAPVYRQQVTVSAVVATPRSQMPCRVVQGTVAEQADAVAEYLSGLLDTHT